MRISLDLAELGMLSHQVVIAAAASRDFVFVPLRL